MRENGDVAIFEDFCVDCVNGAASKANNARNSIRIMEPERKKQVSHYERVVLMLQHVHERGHEAEYAVDDEIRALSHPVNPNELFLHCPQHPKILR